MPGRVEGNPGSENPPPALPLTISPDQICRFGILGRFSLHWLPKTFSFCFPERELPICLAVETLQLYIPQPHCLGGQGGPEAPPSTSRDLVPLFSNSPLPAPNHLLWAAHTPYPINPR